MFLFQLIKIDRCFDFVRQFYCLWVFFLLMPLSQVQSKDWPQWRFDANRSAHTSEQLEPQLKMIWKKSFGKREQVWDDTLNHDLMPYDRVFEPIVISENLIFGFNDRDMLISLNTKTGQENWRFYMDGPVRFPPSSLGNKVFVTSDDGYLYCVDAIQGKMLWKFRGGPSERKVLGNKRIISSWPARGGPVVRDDRVYFAASIWPFMGTFIYCLDAQTGKLVWVNDGTSAQYIKQPHSAPSFAGVAPQGALVATKEHLLVPGGRSVPAAFDLQTGAFQYFPLAKSGKGVGGSFVVANDNDFFVHTRKKGVLQYDLKTGKKGSYRCNEPVLGSKLLYSWAENKKKGGFKLFGLPFDLLSSESKAPHGAVDRSKWKLVSTDSMHRRHEGTKAFDGKLGSMWHTSWNKGAPKHPHEIVIDLGKSYSTNAVVCQPRVTKEDGMIKDYELFISESKEEWGEPVAKGTFKKSHSRHTVSFSTVKGRYLKLRALSAVNGDIYTTLAEIYVLDANRKAKQIVAKKLEDLPWALNIAGPLGDMIQAGDSLYYGGKDFVSSVQLPKGDVKRKKGWSVKVSGNVQRLLAANGKLFAITLEGDILAFASEKNAIVQELTKNKAAKVLPEDEKINAEVKSMLLKCHANSGYALCFGMPKVELLMALIKQTKLQIKVVLDDTSRINGLRRKFDDAAYYGSRISFSQGTVSNFKAPAYLARLTIINEGAIQDSFVNTVLSNAYTSVRPYGGAIWVRSSSVSITQIKKMCIEGLLSKAEVQSLGSFLLVKRQGALENSDDWTHQYGNIANSVKSDDARVKLPLGVLWFGGVSNEDVLPRHGHGPPEQVVAGRLIIEGQNELSARDVYTGRLLWNRSFKDLQVEGIYWDKTYKDTPLSTKYNQVHIPGANVRGTNYVATEEIIYLAMKNKCLFINAETGNLEKTIFMPKPNSKKEADWAYIGVYKDLLIGGQGFALYSEITGEDATGFNTWRRTLGYSASRGLVVFDRKTGKEAWRVSAKHSFIHNGVVVGNGLLYCLDRLPLPIEEVMLSKGKLETSTYRIVAYDVKTGEKKWQTNKNVFGTWLSLSEKHQVLIQAGSRASDRGRYEVGKGMIAYNSVNGKEIWKNDERKYTGPLILHNDLLITTTNSYAKSRGAFNLKDGKPYYMKNHITGEKETLSFSRAYGCNTAIASENLLTFRSGAAGFYDLKGKSGTGNFGGFKSGCTSNLVVANGVLNAPDYTRTCSCSYQNQTSLAMVHMPNLEIWTNTVLGQASEKPGLIKRVGINLGAPGDRLSDTGTLWLEYPKVGGDSPDLGVNVKGSNLSYFRSHSLRSKSDGLPWVGASGIRNIKSLSLNLKSGGSKASIGLGASIANGKDDAEEAKDSSVNYRSSDLELILDQGPQVIGLRFNKLKVHSLTDIQKAFLQFTVDEKNNEATTLRIYGEATDNAKPIKEVKKNLSARIKTKAFVEWKPKAWQKIDFSGPKQMTPDLSSIIKEIISRPGWKQGNSICFLISGTGKRVAISYDKEPKKAPSLIIQSDDMKESLDPSRKFSVSLIFREPDDLPIGARVFDVLLQGQVILKDFDVRKEAGDAGHSIIRTFKNIKAQEKMMLEFRAKADSKAQPVLCGFEIIQE